MPEARTRSKTHQCGMCGHGWVDHNGVLGEPGTCPCTVEGCDCIDPVSEHHGRAATQTQLWDEVWDGATSLARAEIWPH